MSQTSLVLEHLYTAGSITSIEAFAAYGITRLSDTIFKLRNRGYNIVTTTETGKNRYGAPVSYARYSLGSV